MNIGAHISIAKGYTNAVKVAHEIRANTFQFFTRNPRGKSVKKLDEKDINSYLSLSKKLNFGPLVAHAPYIINLASPIDEIWNLGIEILIEDLNRLEKLEVALLCLHPGNHMGSGIEIGAKRISEGLSRVFEQSVSVNVAVLLETMSGSGTELGKSFEELKLIKDNCAVPERIGFCFDTCHVYAAGYDIKNNLVDVLIDFDKHLGLENLKVFHINDCKGSCGSRKDRHANIGEGLLGNEFFSRALTKSEFSDKILILETPSGGDAYTREIQQIRKWSSNYEYAGIPL